MPDMTTTPSREAREAAAQFFGDAENHPTVVRALELLITKVQLEERERCVKAARDAITCGGVGERHSEMILADAAEAAIRQQEREQ